MIEENGIEIIIEDSDEIVQSVETAIDIIKVYPELEDLEVTPSSKEQNYNGSFGNVLVHKVQGEDIIINPSREQQNFNGLYENIIVNKIQENTLDVTPSLEKQTFNGVYTEVNVNEIEAEDITITPTTEDQTQEGIFKSVTIAGDRNLVAGNIKSGTTIFGIEGNFEGESTLNAKIEIATSDTTFDIKKYITEILNLDLSKITINVGFQSAFKNFENLTKVSFISTSRIHSFYQTFYGCKKLTSISEIDGSNCTSFAMAFISCESLKNVKIINTSNNTSCNQMFSSCSALEEVPEMDTSKVTNTAYIFLGCTSLKNVGGLINVGKAFSTQTTNNYLYDLNLTYDVANGGTLYSQQLILGAANLEKLTAEEIAIATNKGWNVS